MLTYRCLQVFELSWNNIFRDYFILVIHNVGILLIVFSNYSLIRFKENEPNLIILALLIISLYCTTYIILANITFGRYNEVSKGFIGSWRRKIDMSYYDRRAALKYIKSCRLLKIESGSFGYFKIAATPNAIGKLIFYTVKLLMLTKEYS